MSSIEKTNRKISVLVDTDTLEFIKTVSDGTKISQSDVIRCLLNSGIKEMKDIENE